MEIISEKTILSDVISRFTEPAKYKIKLYQIAVLMYIDTLVTIFISKYLFFRVKIEEKKTNLKIVKFQQSQIKLDIVSSENLRRNLLVLKRLKLKVKHSIGNIQSMHEHCVTHKETPDLFCEPHIHTGFRPINKPYSYYAKSLFTKHNETINAWSHYMGAIYTLSLALRYDFSDPYSWPILTSIFTATIMFTASATAHLMHQKSHLCHMTCFLCDFAGISFNGYGAAFMQIYICSPLWYYRYIEPAFLPLIGFMSAMCCVFNCLAQTNYKRPYPPMKRFLQFAPCGVLWLFTIIPTLLPLFTTEPDPKQAMELQYSYHLLSIFIFVIGAAFFALDFPQRFFPGKFDFFGQGHHLFHLCIFAVVMLQLNGCYIDFKNNRDIIAASRPPPSLQFCFGSLLILLTYYTYVIYKFYKAIEHNFDKNGNIIEVNKNTDELKQD